MRQVKAGYPRDQTWHAGQPLQPPSKHLSASRSIPSATTPTPNPDPISWPSPPSSLPLRLHPHSVSPRLTPAASDFACGCFSSPTSASPDSLSSAPKRRWHIYLQFRTSRAQFRRRISKLAAWRHRSNQPRETALDSPSTYVLTRFLTSPPRHFVMQDAGGCLVPLQETNQTLIGKYRRNRKLQSCEVSSSAALAAPETTTMRKGGRHLHWVQARPHVVVLLSPPPAPASVAIPG